MTSVKVSITINAPRPIVWRQLAQIERHIDWMMDATAIRFLGDRRRGVGTTFECDTKVGPFRLTDVMAITEWEEGRAMAVVHRGAVRGMGRFTLAESPGSGTTLTWDEQLTFPWWLGGAPGSALARPVLRAIWKGNLRRFSAGVNGGFPSASPGMTTHMADDQRVDEASEESIPASDPPEGWSGRDPEDGPPEPTE